MCVSQFSTSTLSPDSSQDAKVPGSSLAQLSGHPSARGGTRRSLANMQISPTFWPPIPAYLTSSSLLAPSPSCLVFLVVAKSLHLDSHKNHLPLEWAWASVIFQALRGCRHAARVRLPQGRAKYSSSLQPGTCHPTTSWQMFVQ